MTPIKFSRDFKLMVLGQIVSLFGNSILRFALSLYVLELTGSATAFGGILALSMIPTVLCAPLGGVLADRVPRQRIMAGLDFLTAALAGGYALLTGGAVSLAAVGLLMLLLSVIQAVYQPAVQASIPALVPPEGRMTANGTVAQVQALATLLGPILGGALYGWMGLTPMLWVSGGCFLASAVMECFLRIPFTPPERRGTMLAGIAADLKEAGGFLVRDEPHLFRMLLLLAGLNLLISPVFVVGLPYLVKVHLGLSAQLYGAAEGVMGLGSILGGVLSGPVLGRMAFRHAHRFLLGCSLLLLPVTAALLLGLPALGVYGVLLACVLLGLACVMLFNIAAQTFVQQVTPPHLMGKTAAFITAVCTCAAPLGQALYGVAFDALRSQVWAPVLLGAVSGVLLSLAAGRVLAVLADRHAESAGPAVP